MADFDFSDKFPDMRPIVSAPSLSNVNGFGSTMLGRRNYDPESDTYVKMHCFCVLFLPLLVRGAYRVADAHGGGWYFLGRVPLPGLARLWNVLCPLLLLAAGGLVGWHFYTSSAGYIAGQKMKEAEQLVAEGQAKRAAKLYREVMGGPTSHAKPARDKLKGLAESSSASAEEMAGVFAIVLELHRQNDLLVPDLYERGLGLVKKHATADPRGALAVLETIASLAQKPGEIMKLRRPLLERLVASDPKDVELASRLAVVYDELGELALCEKLLRRHEKQLGVLEGAGILGRIYTTQGKYEQAHALLNPYVEEHLPKLQEAERVYKGALENAQKRAAEEFTPGTATNVDFVKFDKANDAEKNAIFRAYILGKIKDDPGIRSAQQELAKQWRVIPASIELGMVKLHRAQKLADPEARRKELESAEKTFLSIRSLAGEQDDYRINLGQVYYWLGKHAEGRKLFDELLKKRDRAFATLFTVSRILREVGAVSEARSLIEEAYKKATEANQKQGAALLRAIMHIDLDDRITWLGRANPDNLDAKALLSSARGHKAQEEGKDDEAIKHFRAAIATYGKMPENSATLNNCANVHFALYQVTFDRAEFTRGADKLDRALALLPGDSILLSNAVGVLLDNATHDVIGGAIDFKVLKRVAGLHLLPYLYRDQAGRQKYNERLGKHPGMIKARGYLEKLLVLAPKQASAYVELAELFALNRDLEGLRGLQERLGRVELDLVQQKREALDAYAGKKDEKSRQEFKVALSKQQKVLEAARKVGGVTLAVAASTLSATKMSTVSVGLEVDPDEVVKLAEEAHTASPSSGTQSGLVASLIFRAHRTLIKTEPAYAEMARKTQRSLGSDLVRYVLVRKGELGDKAMANPDVKRAIQLQLDTGKRFPQDRGPRSWALLQRANPEEAARIVQVVQKDAVSQTARAINRILSPWSATVALEAHWALLLAGKEALALEVLKQSAAQGIPLPESGK
jgi:tetratricopeptide (TPR) repeat protein